MLSCINILIFIIVFQFIFDPMNIHRPFIGKFWIKRKIGSPTL